jgi:RNA polymerase sigma-70 factor (ECF subfamily)
VKLKARDDMRDAAASRLYVVGAPATQTSDADLVAAYQGGAEWASRAIWDRFSPFVRRLLARAMGPGQDVEDLVQEVFIRLYRTIPTLRDPSSLRNFMLTIVTRVVQTELRVRWFRRWLGLVDSGEMPDLEAQPADLEGRAAIERFYAILDSLSAKHRSAFVLRHVEGLELTDVASALNVSLATIKRWLQRAVQHVESEARRDPLLARYVSAEGSMVVLHGQ